MDRIIEGMCEEHNIKLTLIDGVNTINEILKLQKPNQLASEVLGRATLATALISSPKKNNKTISYINGGGPIGLVVSEFVNGNPKSYCSDPRFDDSKIEKDKNVISQVVGTQGTLKVIKGNQKSEESDTKAIYLVSGEINLDFTYHLMQNEKLKGLLLTAIKFDKGKAEKAVGFLVNLLPEASDSDFDYLEESVKDVNLLHDKLLNSNKLEDLFNLYKGTKLSSESELSFKCDCSEEKSINTLKLLGDKQKKEILESKESIEIKCDFCLKNYLINYDKIKQVLS